MDTINDTTEDDEQEWTQNFAKTEFSCAYSAEDISFEEEVVVFRVAVATLKDGKFYADHPVTHDHTKLLYDPVFVTLESWEELNSSLSELTEDLNGISDPHGICECGYCKSDIRAGELFILATLGEIRLSERAPEGLRSSTFVDTDNDPTPCCLTCAALMYDEVLVLWTNGVKQNSECLEGTKNRCWRYGCPADEERGCDLTRRTHLNVLPS